MNSLSKEGRQQLALAILLLKDFKCEGRFDVDVYKMCHELAEHCGVAGEFADLIGKIPAMKIEPRYK